MHARHAVTDPLQRLLWLLWIGAAGVLLGTADAAAQTEGRQLYVEKFAFTNEVNADRNFDREFTERAPVSPIVLWTRIVGTQQALETMRAQGRLPIRHKWFVSCGVTVQFDRSPVLVDEVSLDVGRERVFDSLQLEIDNRTYFDWRTWSRKQEVSRCWYQVRVVDNRNRPLYCEQIHGDCILDITLGE